MLWGLLHAVVAVGKLLQYGLQTGVPGRTVSGQFGDDEAEHLGQRRELRLWDHRHRNVLQETWNYVSIHLIISVLIVSTGRKFTHFYYVPIIYCFHHNSIQLYNGNGFFFILSVKKLLLWEKVEGKHVNWGLRDQGVPELRCPSNTGSLRERPTFYRGQFMILRTLMSLRNLKFTLI